jgi:hypothetical protein
MVGGLRSTGHRKQIYIYSQNRFSQASLLISAKYFQNRIMMFVWIVILCIEVQIGADIYLSA